MSRPPKNAIEEPGRARGLADLYLTIAEALDAGSSVPCMSEPSLWLSEGKAEQEAAGWRCMACSAISQCREYVLAFPEPSSVWAGMTPSDRPKAR